MNSHPLDYVLWHALTGPQSGYAGGQGSARRYHPDVSILAALAPESGPGGWIDLRGDCAVGDVVAVFFFDAVPPIPEGARWRVVFEGTFDQMVCSEVSPAPPATATIETLTPADVDDMLALIDLTHPGPFARRTIELGRYLGVRVGGLLVAMTGERVHISGFREVSAVCTHPEHRGRGLADELVRAVVAGLSARGETGFLHVATDNRTARRAYERIGFVTRRAANVVAVQAR